MADEENCFKMGIPDPDFARGCQAVWGLGNELFVFAGQGKPGSDRPSGHTCGPQGPIIHKVQWQTEMHGPISRKLVNEAHNIFLDLQKLASEPGKSGQLKPQIVKFSRKYRAVIKTAVLDFQASLEKTQDAAEKLRCESQLQLYNMMELVWNMCEILFIERQPGGILLTQLLEWLRLHFNEVDRKALVAIGDEMAEDHEFFWECVFTFILQGRMDEARQMLDLHSNKRTSAFTSMDELLRKMPLFSRFSGQWVGEFEMKWRHWQEECQYRLAQGNFASNPNLQTICRILCGEDDVFLELNQYCESWYGMLVSRLLYQNPTINPFDLQHHTQFCIDAYGGNLALQPWDHIILAAIEFDIHQVIKESSSGLGQWWLVAHLTDLLHHAGQLQTENLKFGATLREFLLLEFSSSLMSHESLWQIGASYLDHCKEYGRHHLELYIEHIPIRTEIKARKIIRLCEKHNMQDQVKSICKTMAMKAVQNRRLGSALSWCLRSKDVAFINYLAERFLNEYSESGDFTNLDLVDNLGPSMLLSNKLTFLGKYREFHQLYEEGEQKGAAALLLSLLTSRLAPKRFWTTMLTDALPLLEVQEVVFSSQQTYELMHCLEEHMMSQKLQEMECQGKPAPNVARKETENEKLDLLKLALCRNLARAIVQEGNTKI